LLALVIVGTHAQEAASLTGYKLPTKEQKLDSKGQDPDQADLVLVLEEQTLEPSFMSDGNVRLRDTLAVFPTGGPGRAPPSWVGITTENGLAAAAALTTPDAEDVVERFRRDVEEARNRARK
jgi:hypothetical protein